MCTQGGCLSDCHHLLKCPKQLHPCVLKLTAHYTVQAVPLYIQCLHSILIHSFTIVCMFIIAGLTLYPTYITMNCFTSQLSCYSLVVCVMSWSDQSLLLCRAFIYQLKSSNRVPTVDQHILNVCASGPYPVNIALLSLSWMLYSIYMCISFFLWHSQSTVTLFLCSH